MVDVSSKKETFRRALASGKIYVGKEVFSLIKNKEMPKGDPVSLARERYIQYNPIDIVPLIPSFEMIIVPLISLFIK